MKPMSVLERKSNVYETIGLNFSHLTLIWSELDKKK